MVTPTVSIIVPVYNTERYLRRCVDSILAQTFSDFEVLLVDDGSTDGSGSICDEYAERDSRVRVFHKSNGGVSSARNIGLDHAQGEWINFIDSDDWVETNYLKILISQSEDADLSICDFKLTGSNEVWVDNIVNGIYSGVKLKEFYEKTFPNVQLTAPWAKLYKHDIIKNNNLYFDETLQTIEDTLFVLNYLCYVDKVVVSTCQLYNYWRGDIGLSNPRLQIEFAPIVAPKILDALESLSKITQINIDKLFEAIIGGYIYRKIFTKNYSFKNIIERFSDIDKNLLNHAVMGGGNLIGRKHKIIAWIVVKELILPAAILYKIFK